METGFPVNAQQAKELGWTMHGVYPRPDQPLNLHGMLMSQGNLVADLPFTRKGRLVPKGQYALWIRPLT